MKITFLGAARTVTGSCYLVETENIHFFVDCGMFQGKAAQECTNEASFPIELGSVDFILLTHAHIDHSGRIPYVFNNGFKGQVYATKPTVELCGIMLPDSGHVQEMEAEWSNRKRLRAGNKPIPPLYTSEDAKRCLKLFKSVMYDELIKPVEGITIQFRDAGHILGSSIIEINVVEKDRNIKLVFSGDLGNKGMPILRDPSIIENADYLIIESTYGNRHHERSSDNVKKFIDTISETMNAGGNLIIPSFAVGRTQEVIYYMHNNRQEYMQEIDRFSYIPVFVDSPLAISATEIFRNNLDCFDQEAREYIKNGDNPLDFPGLQFTRTAEESKALNTRSDSIIVISASGMCDAGRIKHHLKHNLWRSDSTILFVGYQAEGTLGRRLVDGAKKVTLFGEEISVKARIIMLEGFSGHADKDGLLEWIGSFSNKPSSIFIVHGEEDAISEFSGAIEKMFNIESVVPLYKSSYELIEGGRILNIARGTEPEQTKLTDNSEEIENTIKRVSEKFNSIITELTLKAAGGKEIDSVKSRLKYIDQSLTNTK